MKNPDVERLLEKIDHSLRVSGTRVYVVNEKVLRQKVHLLVEASSFGSAKEQGWARYLVRKAALSLGVFPSSIHDLYIARGKGKLPHTFTVPAMNLRALSFDAAKAVFRVALSMDAGAFIFEIARSEMGYTDQRPSEYATNILAAAVAEGYQGPVFIQGDHFQVSAKRFATNPEVELQAVRDLTLEAIRAGFFNIDIDTSTLVDITKPTVPEQQELNSSLSAMYTSYIRELQPAGVTISVGGEIGEVGGHNSNPEELRAYMVGYLSELLKLDPAAVGLSKISIQTGTSHGGVVLPDGSIASVNVDFGTLFDLSQIARSEFGMGGAVQHGASTLPENAFGKFVESEAIEVHLATNFQNILYENLPATVRTEMYAWLDQTNGAERKPGMTDEQFYYKTRKNAIGPFKKQLWNLDAAERAKITQLWEAQFRRLFTLLGARGTKVYVAQTISPAAVEPDLAFYLGVEAGEEEVGDLAD